MPRLATTSVALVLSSAAALLSACGEESAPGPSGGAPAFAGAAGSAVAGSGVSGGAAGSSAGSSSAGEAGTGTGGSGSGGSSSSGGSAGSGSAGSSSGGGGAGQCNGALLCDDFEAYTGMPGAPWKVDKNAQGTVVIDDAQHNSGTKAVKVSLSGAATYQRAFIGVEAPFPIAGNAFYGRMMIFTTAAPNDGVHWTMIQAEGPVVTPKIERAMVRYGGQQMQRLMANYDSAGTDAPKSDCWKHSQTKMPEGKWACMEWYFDGATNTQKFWLDDTAVEDLTVVEQGDGCLADGTGNKWLFPTFERLFVGFESYQADAAREVWIDDVAVSTTKIGCP